MSLLRGLLPDLRRSTGRFSCLFGNNEDKFYYIELLFVYRTGALAPDRAIREGDNRVMIRVLDASAVRRENKAPQARRRSPAPEHGDRYAVSS
jgi:hypothetical protein